MPGNSSTTGRSPPSNSGAGNDVLNFVNANEPKRIVDIGTETSSLAVKASSGNGGTIYIGFGDETSTANGYPLAARQSLSLNIDTNEDPLYAVADTAGDGLRWIAVE